MTDEEPDRTKLVIEGSDLRLAVIDYIKQRYDLVATDVVFETERKRLFRFGGSPLAKVWAVATIDTDVRKKTGVPNGIQQ